MTAPGHGACVNASLAYATLENAGLEVRLGLGSVRHIGDELAERMVDERKANGPFGSLLDLTGRVQLSVPQTEALATAGALGCFGITRREGLWAAGAAATQRPDRLPGVGSSSHIPSLPGMTELELAAADVWATGISGGLHDESIAVCVDLVHGVGGERVEGYNPGDLAPEFVRHEGRDRMLVMHASPAVAHQMSAA